MNLMASETGTRQALENGTTTLRSSHSPQPLNNPADVTEGEDRIERIRDAIKNGTYEVDSLELSRAIVQRHIRAK